MFFSFMISVIVTFQHGWRLESSFFPGLVHEPFKPYSIYNTYIIPLSRWWISKYILQAVSTICLLEASVGHQVLISQMNLPTYLDFSARFLTSADLYSRYLPDKISTGI